MNTFLKLLRWVRWIMYGILGIIILAAIAAVIIRFSSTPSNDREWSNDQKILSYAEISGSFATVHNIRNFTYASTTSYTENYYDKTFDLNKIKKVWYIVEPFSGIPGSAHTFLGFEFENNEFVSISVEIRKEKGEAYNPIVGLFSQYELMYVIADERDAIKLRTNYRKDEVYLYPSNAGTEKTKALFVDMLTRANELRDNPEFYNTITNTCTTNIVKHIDTITPDVVPLLSLRILLPAGSDRLAYDLGLLDTDLPFEKARERYHINERAMKYANDADFSVKIRRAQ